MAITMSRRERRLLTAALGLAALAIVYITGLKGWIDTFGEKRETLRAARAEFDRYMEYINKQGREVERDYTAMEQRYPMGDQLAAQVATKMEAALKRIGMPQNFQASTVDPIENLEEYGFVTLPLNSSGDINQTVQMLRHFDDQAILVTQLELTSVIDNPSIRVKATVSQIVKLSQEMKEQLDARSSSGSSRGPRRRESIGDL